MNGRGTEWFGKRLAATAVLLWSAWLLGCASPPAAQKTDQYDALYEGESEASYATAFPVASPAEAYRNGDEAMGAGDYDRALFEYIRGLRMAEAPSGDALYKVGRIHHQRENYQLAGMAYRWSLQVNPDNPVAGTGLGLVLLQQRQYEAAKLQLQKVVTESNQAPWRAYNALGILADMAGAVEEAEGYYQQALSLNPGSPLILNNLGYSRYLAGKWETAAEALHSALRTNGRYELAWRNLGLVYARQKKYGLALDALRRSGSESEAYNDVGFVAMLEGDYPRALALFDKAMRLSPTFYVTASENADNARRLINRNHNSDQF